MSGKLKKLIASFLAVCTLTSAAAPAAFAGWKQNTDKTWIYTQGSSRLTGWQKINNVWYYFNPNGIMQTGWQKIKNVWYYLKPSGAMATGWAYVNGAWYYLKPSGAMATGWAYVNGAWYYLKPSGAMATGWAYVNGSWYYMNGSGAMQTGWLELKGKTYYLLSDGRMAVGQVTIDGKIYVFDENGESSGSRSPEDLASEAFAKEMLKLVNQRRAEAGKQPLALSDKLSQIAKARCAELQKEFSHTRPDGSQWYTIFPEYGISGAGTGENIARYYYDAAKLMTDLMNSPAHKANILSSDFKEIGIYYLTDSYGYPYIVQLFSNQVS